MSTDKCRGKLSTTQSASSAETASIAAPRRTSPTPGRGPNSKWLARAHVISCVIFTNSARAQIQGRLHWNALTYGTMEKYEEVIERPGRIRIPIIDLSSNAIFQKMAEWIKSNFEN